MVIDDKAYRIRGSLRLKRYREWGLSGNGTILMVRGTLNSVIASASEAIDLSAQRKNGLLRRKGSSQ
jgi:hypothetical protein